MKRIFLALIVMLASISSFAQVKGDKAVGVNLSYGTEISSIGIGVKGQYNITDVIRGEASFGYFLEKDGMKMWDINVNAHYLFPVAEKIKVYPLVGFTYSNWRGGWSIDDEETREWMKELGAEDDELGETSNMGRFGVNLGGGASYDLTDKLSLNFELKYQLISDFNQAVFSIGAAYKF